MLNRLNDLRDKRAKGEEGFTLIELLVVVVIIGILIAIAIPLYLNYTKGANDKSAESDVRGAIGTLEQCNSDNSAYPTGLVVVAPVGTAPSTGYTATGCAGQTIKISANTTLSYAYTAASSSYLLHGYNSKGAPKYWCYNSLNGGSVKTVASNTTAC